MTNILDDSTDYSRQKELNIIVPQKISIVGVGGTGSWVALFSAMSGVKQINLFDSDTVDKTNIARMIYKPNMVGRKKTECLKEIIKELRPSCNILPFDNITEVTLRLLNNSNCILCCTDTIDSQRLIYDYCLKYGLRFFRVGYDGLNLTMTRKVSKWGKGIGRYEIAPSWVIPTAIASAVGVAQMTVFNYTHGTGRLFPDEMSGNLENLRFNKVKSKNGKKRQ